MLGSAAINQERLLCVHRHVPNAVLAFCAFRDCCVLFARADNDIYLPFFVPVTSIREQSKAQKLT